MLVPGDSQQVGLLVGTVFCGRRAKKVSLGGSFPPVKCSPVRAKDPGCNNHGACGLSRSCGSGSLCDSRKAGKAGTAFKRLPSPAKMQTAQGIAARCAVLIA